MFLHEQAEGIKKFFEDWDFDPLAIAPLGFLILAVLASLVNPEVFSAALAATIFISPVWLPLFLAVFFWTTWMHYIRYMFWFSQEWVLLEIQLPPEVQKSPLAMELFLTSIWNSGGESTFIARMWEGKFRAVWSLEIASNEGRIAFYIHTRKAWQPLVEARLYGQFPEAKILEVDDYASKVPFNLEEYGLWGAEFDKTADPQALPIRTYTDYLLDKDTDTPETKVDPITNTLELMNNLGKDEYLWMQIIIRARKKDEWHGFYLKHDHFAAPAKEGIKKITEQAIKRAREFTSDEAEKKKVGSRGSMLLTEAERDKVEAIERSLTKNIFEAGFRVVYLAKKERFKGINIGAVVKFFDAYRYPGYNSLGPSRGMSIFNLPWQDFMDIRSNLIKRKLFFRYKHRAYFYVPYEQKPNFVTTEELATLWHFPGSWVQTPGLQRVTARRAEAPSNLPTLPS